MESSAIGTLLLLLNILISYRGFSNRPFFDAYKFQVDAILLHKEYKRLVSSGFLHANWLHLIFNMIALNSFCNALLWQTHEGAIALIYFAALLGGNLLALYLHRNHGDYSAIGASGAVSGIVFACVGLDPGIRISILLLPDMPGWFFGILYVLYSIYGIRSQSDNIGHEAHLGGALVGLLTAVALYPEALNENGLTIAAIALPALAFLIWIVKKPEVLLIGGNKPAKPQKFYTLDDRYNAQKRARQQEMDRILEKIHKKGYDSLTAEERDFLKKG